MRGEFNKTFTVRYGPRSLHGPPGVVYGTGVPCRRVGQNRIGQGQFDFSMTGVWMTEDAGALHGPATSSPWIGAVFTDQMAADEVAFTDSPAVWYSVCREEYVEPLVGDPYWRYLLLPVTSFSIPPWPPLSPPPPAPPPPPPAPVLPGIDCASAAVLPGVGEWSVSSVDSAVSGWYVVDYEVGSGVHVSVVGEWPATVSVSVYMSSPEGACSSLAWMNAVGAVGYPCVSDTAPYVVGDHGRLYLVVVNYGGAANPYPVTVGVGLGGCDG